MGKKHTRPYRCCKHCRKECPDADKGHVQACVEDHCPEGKKSKG